MKKLRYHGVARSQEQPRPLEPSIFAEQQAQAKSGTVTAPSGADAIIKAVGDVTPFTNTLAGTLRDALAAATLDKIGIINLANRTVTVVPAGTDIAAVSGATGLSLAATVTLDDPTKPSGPMSSINGGDAGSDEVDAIVGAAKPSLSVESLCNKIEDAAIDPTGQMFGVSSGIIVVDQANKDVKLYTALVAEIEAVTPATLLAEDAHFVQTLVSSTGRQFGE